MKYSCKRATYLYLLRKSVAVPHTFETDCLRCILPSIGKYLGLHGLFHQNTVLHTYMTGRHIINIINMFFNKYNQNIVVVQLIDFRVCNIDATDTGRSSASLDILCKIPDARKNSLFT